MGRLALVVVGAVLLGIVLAQHTHSHEAPHSKYGREVNEQAAQEAAAGQHAHAHAHGHSHEGGKCPYSHGSEPESHGHDHDEEAHHGHAHEHTHSHGHAHEDHGHSHEDHGHSHEGHGHAHTHTATKRSAASDDVKYEGFLSFMNDAKTRTRVHAIGATLLISAAPFAILFFIPIQTHNAESDPLLKVLLAFGSGGLLGDAFLHLIPHATPADSGHAHSHAHSHEGGHGHSHDNSVGGWVLGGIIAFLVVEKLVRILRGGDGHGHSHGHIHEKISGKSSDADSDKDDDKSTKKKDKKKKQVEQKTEEGIKVAAYLNFVADFTHNFTDGLAIGASFLAGPTVGFITTLTVLVHEVPHEIGDFAILIQSGMSKKKAMLTQLVTALGALSGCVLSLWVADAGELADAAAHSWILPFTAGGFIYIATVSVIPELLENSSTWQSIKEIFALLLGIYLMYLIALYE